VNNRHCAIAYARTDSPKQIPGRAPGETSLPALRVRKKGRPGLQPAAVGVEFPAPVIEAGQTENRLPDSAFGTNMRIALLNPSGWGNLGDAAIIEAIATQLRRRLPHAQIIAITLNPRDTVVRHRLPALPMRHLPATLVFPGNSDAAAATTGKRHGNSIFRLLLRFIPQRLYEIALAAGLFFASFKVMKNITSLVIAGGGQLDELWGGPWEHPYSLFRWSLCAKLRRRPVLFLSVGAGKTRSPLSRSLLSSALRGTAFRSFRDPRSRTIALELGSPEPNLLVPDAAFSYQPRTGQESARSAQRIAVSPMVYMQPRAWPESDPLVYRLYISRLADTVSRFLQRGYQIVLVPSEIHMDRIAIDTLYREVTSRVPSTLLKSVEFPDVLTLEHFTLSISRCAAFIGSRLHGLLLAALCSTPVIALSYDWKVDELMKDLRATDSLRPIVDFDPEEIVNLAIRDSGIVPSGAIPYADVIERNRQLLAEQFDNAAEMMLRERADAARAQGKRH